MFGLLKTKEEKEYGLHDFIGWARRHDAAKSNFQKVRMASMGALQDYMRLETLEQKLYAAYTSFDPNLKDLIKEELDTCDENRKIEALKVAYHALEEKGKSGCSHLLKRDYRNYI